MHENGRGPDSESIDCMVAFFSLDARLCPISGHVDSDWVDRFGSISLDKEVPDRCLPTCKADLI